MLTGLVILMIIKIIYNTATSVDKVMYIIQNPIILLVPMLLCIAGIIAIVKSE